MNILNLNIAKVAAILVASMASLSQLVYSAPDDLDAAFMSTVNLGSSVPINAVAVESGGTILIGGNYGTFEGSATEAVMKRLNADGSLNTVVDDFATTTGNPEINSIVVQPDGKILVGGVFNSFDGQARSSILRLNSDLTLDTGFAPSGIGYYLGGGFVQSIVLQSDNKILVSGYFPSMNGVSINSIARLEADGGLDPSFTPANLQSDGYYGGSYPGTVDDMSVQADGRIIISGGFDRINGSPAGNITRLLGNGSLDTSFNPGTGTDYRANSNLVLPDGRILVGGNLSTYNGQTVPSLACLLPTGAVDTTFQANLGSGFDGWTGGDIVLGPDGYIYVGGIFTLVNGVNTASIAKLALDGTVQTDFNPIPGQPRGSWVGHTYGIAHQTDGKILIVGWIGPISPAEVASNITTINGTLIYNIARFEGNGGAGPGTIKVITTSTATPENGGTVTLYATRINGGAGAASVNYSLASGTATAGSDFTAATGTLNWASGELGTKLVTVTLLNDVLAEGSETFSLNLSSASGASLGDATTTVTILDDDSIPLIVTQPQSVQAVSGYSTTLSVSVSSVLSVTYQWKKDGAVIPGATSSNYVIGNVGADDAGDYTVEVTNANGTATSATATLDVLVPSGSLDEDFTPSLSSAVRNFIEMADGSILAVTQGGQLLKLDDSGSPAAGFTAPSFTLGGSAAALSAVYELADGKLLVAGSFDSVGGATGYNLARLNADGSVDGSFTPLASGVNPITAMDVNAAGNIYVGFYGGSGLAKITSAGILDAGFTSPAGAGSGTSGSIGKIEVQPDGDLLIASYDNQGFSSNYNRLRRIDSSGLIDPDFHILTPNWYVHDWTLLPDGRLAVVGGFNSSLPTNLDGISIPTRLVFLDPTTGEIFDDVPTPVVNNQVYSVAYNDGFIVIGGIFTAIDGAPVPQLARFRLDGTLNDSFDIATGPNGTVSQIEVDANGNFIVAGSFTQFAGTGQSYLARLNRGPGTVGFPLSGYSINEDAGNSAIPVTRFGDLSGAASVTWAAIESGSAVDGIDYIAATGTLNWADGDGADKLISVAIVDNATAEAPRDFQIVLSNATVALIDRSDTTVTIYDDDTLATFLSDQADRSLVANSATSISVEVDSQTAVSYQWFKDGVLLPGETDATLSFASFSPSDAAAYSVKVTNSAGTVTSSVFTVALRQPPTDVLAPAFPLFNSAPAALAVTPDGRRYIGGGFSQVNGSSVNARLVRLLADNTVDPTFAPVVDGTVSFVEVLSNGDIIVGGSFSTINGITVPKIARLAPDGTVDTAFIANITAPLGAYTALNRLAVDSLDRLYIIGLNLDGVMKRFAADGTEDTAFTANMAPSFNSFGPSAISIGADDTVFLRGNFNVEFPAGSQAEYIVKLDASGHHQPSFDATYYNNLSTVHALPDGKVLVVATNLIRRLNSDGTEDTSFTNIGNYGGIYGVDPSGQIYGLERISNSEYKLHRYSPNGIFDPVFEVITEANFNAWPRVIKPQADGSVILLGDFTVYNGQSATRIVQLRGDQTVVDIGTGPLLVEPGATASLTATVDGPLPLDFKWYRNGIALNDGGDFSGTDTLSLAIANAQDADEGALSLTAFNPTTGFSATSPTRELVVLGEPEVITDPAAQTLIAGSNLTLTVDVQAASPYTIEWYKGTSLLSDGGNISGAATATLTITSANPSDSGDYRAVITNNLDTVDSAVATVYIIVEPGAPVSTYSSPITGAGFTGVVDTLELADGRVLVASSNTPVGGQTRNLFLMDGNGVHDASFTLNTSSAPRKLYQQADGKILVTGSFSSVGSYNYKYIFRLNADLTLDTAFSANIGTSGNNYTYEAATDAAGRIYVTGEFTSFNGHQTYRIVRLFPDGTVDISFVGGAFQTAQVLSVSEYGVFIGGNFTNYGGGNYLIKLNEDGTRDTSYTADTGNRAVYALGLQDDGKLLVGTSYIPYLRRLETTGANDASFSPSFTLNSSVSDIEVRPSGKILIGGGFTGSGVNRLAQLLPNGTLDPSFDIGTGFDNSVVSVKINLAGQIWVGGYFSNYDAAPARNLLKLSGEPIAILITQQPQSIEVEAGETAQFSVSAIGSAALSYQWKKDGLNLTDGGDISGATTATLSIANAAVDDEGFYSVVVSNAFGTKTSQASELIFLGAPEVLVNADPLDLDVGQAIELSVSARGAGTLTYQWYKDSAALSDGDNVSGASSNTLTITGAGEYDSGNYFLRISNLLGTIDTPKVAISVTIPPAGYILGYDFPRFNSYVRAIFPLGDGRTLVGGQFSSATWTANGGGSASTGRLALVNADGSIDTSFAPNVGGTVHTITRDSSGRILFGGDFTSAGGLSRNRVARLNSDLSFDTSFGSSSGPNSSVYTICVDDDDQIWVGGAFSTFAGATGGLLVRLNEDGSPDTSFSSHPNTTVREIVAIPGGGIYVGGEFSNYQGASYIVRLDADGVRDSNFNPTRYSRVYAVALQDDGKVIIGGQSPYIERLTAAGAVDSNFTSDNGSNFNNNVRDIAVQPNGRIVVVGDFGTYGGQTLVRMARLDSDGKVDPTFEQGTALNSSAYAIGLEPLGNIWIGGAFSRYQGGEVQHIIKLNGDVESVAIISDPRSLSLEAGQSDSFNVSAVSSATIEYQWKKDGSLLAGETSASLSMAAPSVSDEGSYSVVVTNPETGDFVESDAAEFIFLAAPEILELSEDSVLITGQSATLNVVARGAATLEYQWFKDGEALTNDATFSGVQTPALTMTHAALTDAGVYRVDVSNGLGTSAPIDIVIDVILPPAGLDNTWRQAATSDATLDYDSGVNGQVDRVLPLTGGGAIIAGAFTTIDGVTVNGLARVDAVGDLVGTWSNPGFPVSTVMALAELPDGSVLVGGSFFSVASDPSNSYLLKISTDGAIDSSYKPEPNSTVLDIEVLPDGSHVAVGQFNQISGSSHFYIVKLDTSGVVDSGFTIGSGNQVKAVARDSMGRFYFGGDHAPYDGLSIDYSYQYLWRTDAAGVLDTTYPTNRVNGSVDMIEIGSDDQIFVTGSFTYVNNIGLFNRKVASFSSEGVVNSGFAGNGLPGNTFYRIYGIEPTPDGGLIVSYNYTSIAGSSANYIAKLKADGSFDASFAISSGLNNYASDIVTGPDGKVWLGGLFTTYMSTNVNYLTRLNGYPAATSAAAPLDTWKSGLGLTGLAAEPDADDDLDSLPLLIEFILGANPGMFEPQSDFYTLANSDGATLNAADGSLGLDAGKTYATFTVRVRRDLGSVTYEPQASIDLVFGGSSPTASATQVGAAVADGEFDLVTYVASPALDDVASGGKMFFRLSASE